MRRTDPAGGSELIAICTGRALGREVLFAALKDRLAPHLIPEDFIWLDRLPLNANGKIDRGRLAELYSDQIA